MRLNFVGQRLQIVTAFYGRFDTRDAPAPMRAAPARSAWIGDTIRAR